MKKGNSNLNGKFLNVLEAVFQKHGLKFFKGVDIRPFLAQFKVTAAFTFAACQAGVFVKDGYSYALLDKPTAAHAAAIRAQINLNAREYWAKKKNGEPTGRQVPPPVVKSLIPVSLEQAIQVVKNHGYQVRKPVTTFEEV